MGQGVRANMGFTADELEEMRRADAEIDLEFSQAEVDGCLDELLEYGLDAEIAAAALQSDLSHDEWRKHKSRLRRHAKERERVRRLRQESPEYVQRMREYFSKYYYRHWFESLEKGKRYRAKNAETLRLAGREYFKKNRSILLERRRERYRANRHRELYWAKQYRERNRALINARARLRCLLAKHDGPVYVLTSVELG